MLTMSLDTMYSKVNVEKDFLMNHVLKKASASVAGFHWMLGFGHGD